RTAALLGDPSGVANAFLVDMRDGLTRQQAVRQLTAEQQLPDPAKAVVLANIPASGDVWDVGLSPDGRRVAFTTARSLFPLAPPQLVGPPLAQLGLLELYRVDLAGEALERITQGPDDGPSLSPGTQISASTGSGAWARSSSAAGPALAFARAAPTLVAGDANEDSDAFLVRDRIFTAVPGTVAISRPPSLPLPPPRWRLTATASSRP